MYLINQNCLNVIYLYEKLVRRSASFFLPCMRYQKSKATFNLSLNSHVYWNTLQENTFEIQNFEPICLSLGMTPVLASQLIDNRINITVCYTVFVHHLTRVDVRNNENIVQPSPLCPAPFKLTSAMVVPPLNPLSCSNNRFKFLKQFENVKFNSFQILRVNA